MTREGRLDLAVRIAAEFSARDMRSHLPPLRRYYADVRDGREPQPWNDDLVVDWAMAFRVPPFDHAVEVRPMRSDCTCETAEHAAGRPMRFPGGCIVSCPCMRAAVARAAS